jgi:acetyl esterase
LAKERGGPKIAFHAIVYGLLTLEDTLEYPSRVQFGNGEYFGSMKDLEFVRNLYLTNPEVEVKNPLASPILAEDLSQMPPALVITAGYDMVRDENKHYADRLKEVGVPVEYKCFEGTIHPFFLFDGVLDTGKEAQVLLAEKLRKALTK